MSRTFGLRRSRLAAILTAWMFVVAGLPVADGLVSSIVPAAASPGDPFTLELSGTFWPHQPRTGEHSVTVETRPSTDDSWTPHAASPVTVPVEGSVELDVIEGDLLRLRRLGDLEPYEVNWTCGALHQPSVDGGRTIEIQATSRSGSRLRCEQYHSASALEVSVALAPETTDPGAPIEIEVTRPLLHAPGTATDTIQVPVGGTTTALVPLSRWHHEPPLASTVAPVTGLVARHQCFEYNGEAGWYQIAPPTPGEWGEGPAVVSVESDVARCHLVLSEPDPDMIGAAAISSVVAHSDGTNAVELAWGGVEGGERFEVWRNGERLVGLPSGARGHRDSVGGPGPHTYEIVAHTASGPVVIGSPHLVIPDLRRECSVLWTGAVSSTWTEPHNWAPFAPASGQPGAARVPTAQDHACIDVERSLPISARGRGLGPVGKVTGTVTDVVALTAALSRLHVLGDLELPAVTIDGGSLQVDGRTVLSATTEPGVSFRGGTLELGGDLVAAGTVDVAPNASANINSDGTITAAALNLGSHAHLVARGGLDLVVSSVVTADGAVLGRYDDAVLRTRSLHVDGSVELYWIVDSSDGLDIRIAPGGMAVLGEVIELRAGTTWTDVSLDLAGRLYMTSTVEVIDGAVTLDGPDAFIGSYRDNPDHSIGQLAEVRELVVTGGASATSVGDLTVDRLRIDDGALTVADELTVHDEAHLAGAARLTTPAWNADDGLVVRVTGADNAIEGALDLDHGARVELVDLDGSGLGHLAVDTLSVAAQGEIRVGVNADDNGRIVARDVDMDGLFVAVVGETLTGDLETPLLSASDQFRFTGTASLETTTGGDPSLLDGVELDVVADGIWITTTTTVDPPAPCVTPPDVRDITVTGCWELIRPGVYRTDAERADDAGEDASVGGVTMRPAPGVDLFLSSDRGLELDAAQRSSGRPGTVAFSTDVVTRNGSRTPVALGSATVDAWNLSDPDRALALSVDRIAGLPVAGELSLSFQDGFRIAAAIRLPSVFAAGAGLDVAIGSNGIAADSLRTVETTTALLDLDRASGLSATWIGGSTWSVSSDATAGVDVSGSFTHDPDVGWLGAITVGSLRVGELFEVPEFTLVADKITDTWSYETVDASAIIQEVNATFVDGDMVTGLVRMGDPVGKDSAPPVATWGGLVELDGITLEHGGPGQWALSGHLADTSSSVSGHVTVVDGTVTEGALTVTGLNFAGVTTVDLDVRLNDGATYAAAITAADTQGATVSGSGSLTFESGLLREGSLSLDSVSLGALATIDDFAISFRDHTHDGSGRVWDIDGTLVRHEGDPGSATAVAGMVAYEHGALQSASMQIEDLPLGFAALPRFVLTYDATTAAGTTWTVSGDVRAPSVDGASTTAPLDGSLTTDDGQLVAAELSVPYLPVADMAVIVGAKLELQHQGETAILAGSGSVRSATGSDAAAADITIEMNRGAVTRAEVTTEALAFGGLAVLDDFTFSYQRGDEPRQCSFLVDHPEGPAQTWFVTATRSEGRGSTAVEGCLIRQDGLTVAGGISLGDLDVGELFRIEDLTAVFSSGSFGLVTQTPPGGFPTIVTVPVSTFGLVGTFHSGSETTDISGEMVIFDGGVGSAQLDLGAVPLTEMVRIDHLGLAFDVGTPWDDTADTTFKITGQASHDEGTSSLVGTVDFSRVAGRISGIDLRVENIPFGPAVIDELGFVYSGVSTDTSSWAFAGSVSTRDGHTGKLEGSLTLSDGRVQSAKLGVPYLSVGDLALIQNATFTYERLTDSERWDGSGTITSPNSTSAAHVGVEFSDGRLVAGEVQLDRLGWGELFVFEDLHIEAAAAGNRPGDLATWAVSGSLRAGGGETSAVAGSLTFEGGRAVAGSLQLSGLAVADLVVIERAELSVASDTKGVALDAAMEIRSAEGRTALTSGRLLLSSGTLLEAELDLARARLGEMATLKDLRVEFRSADTWAVSATVDHADGTTTLGGSLTFGGGAVTGGSLEIDDLPLGPLHLESLVLAAEETTENLDGRTVNVAAICGVAEPTRPTAGRRWAAQAVVRTGDSDTTAMAGRLRLDGTSVVEGVLCVEDLQVADIARIDSATLIYTSERGIDRWSGAVTVADSQDDTAPFAGSFDFAVSDTALHSARLTASGLNVGATLAMTDVDLGFDRTQDASSWHLSATLTREGEAPGTVAGALQIDRGAIVGGGLSISSIPFGDAFTVNDLELTFAGRRAQSIAPDFGPGQPFDLPGTASCSSAPAPAPSESAGSPGTRESHFSLLASITANDDTFTARGSVGFADGSLTAFDLSASCIPVGDLVTIEDFRLAYTSGAWFTSGDAFRIGGRVRLPDADVAPEMYGNLSVTGGRVVVGELRLGDLPLGPVVLETFRLTIGTTSGATSTWGVGFAVRKDDGNTVGGSGSLSFAEGRVVGGSLSVPEVPLAGLVKIRDLDLVVDGSQPGRTELAGSATVNTANGNGSMAASITFADGRVTAGAFSANAVKVFDLIPVNGFGFAFDNEANSWSGQMSTAGSNSGFPSLRLGVEFVNGRLVSGEFGFDGNGDGVVDAPVNGEAPTSGDGMFGDIPLKALYIRYCATGSVAQFCTTGSAGSWEGRIVIELPSEAAPGINAGLRIRNGQLVRAEFELSGLNIPVFTGVMLNAIRGHVEADPWIAFGGGIGLTVGAPSLTVARVDANFSFDHGPGNPPEYKIFTVSGDVAVFPGNPLGIDINGRVDIEMQTWGYLGVSASIDAELIPKVIGVTGTAYGQIFDASAANVTVTNPKTGAPLTGAVVQMGGGVQARLLGINVAGADFLVNTIGAAGCAYIQIPIIGRAQLGAGFYWSGGVRLTCDMGRYRIVVPGTIAGGQSLLQSVAPISMMTSSDGGGLATTPVAVYRHATVLDTFQIDEGERLLGVDVSSAGTPRVTVIAPDGTRYDAVDDDDVSDGVLITTGDNEKFFVFAAPMAGTWQVVAEAGSPVIDEVGSYLELPSINVGGVVQAGGDGSFRLDYDFDDIDGQEIIFVERTTGSEPEVLGGIGTATRPTPGGDRINGAGTIAAAGTRQLTSGGGAPYLRATPVVAGSGTIEFRPNGSAEGGEREIVALVMQDGLPRDEIVIGTYTAPDAGPAGAPRALNVTETPGGAQVSWQPPVDDGGRRISSYRIKADTGLSVTVDAATESVDLPIPALAPGRVVPVTVQAWTGVGLGDEATVSFTSTQHTPTAALGYGDPDPGDTDPGDAGPGDPDSGDQGTGSGSPDPGAPSEATPDEGGVIPTENPVDDIDATGHRDPSGHSTPTPQGAPGPHGHTPPHPDGHRSGAGDVDEPREDGPTVDLADGSDDPASPSGDIGAPREATTGREEQASTPPRRESDGTDTGRRSPSALLVLPMAAVALAAVAGLWRWRRPRPSRPE